MKSETWEEMVESSWRNRFDEKDSKHTPSTNEMLRMLDNYGWSK